MSNSIFQDSLLTIGLTFLTATSSGQASTPLTYPVLQQEFTHVVKSDETLSSIAFRYYKSEEYWTTVWNDNPELTNKNVISEGMKLKIRAEKPLLIEEAEERSISFTEVIPAEMCYLGWQESLDKLIKLVEPEIPDA